MGRSANASKDMFYGAAQRLTPGDQCERVEIALDGQAIGQFRWAQTSTVSFDPIASTRVFPPHRREALPPAPFGKPMIGFPDGGAATGRRSRRTGDDGRSNWPVRGFRPAVEELHRSDPRVDLPRQIIDRDRATIRGSIQLARIGIAQLARVACFTAALPAIM